MWFSVAGLVMSEPPRDDHRDARLSVAKSLGFASPNAQPWPPSRPRGHRLRVEPLVAPEPFEPFGGGPKDLRRSHGLGTVAQRLRSAGGNGSETSSAQCDNTQHAHSTGHLGDLGHAAAQLSPEAACFQFTS